MSARPFPTADATAFRLAAVLEQYEQDVEELTSTWLDAERYARKKRTFDRHRTDPPTPPAKKSPERRTTMSARAVPNTDAVAIRLAALLDQYEQDIEELTSSRRDEERHARMTRRLEEMRVLCADLPALYLPWLLLMMSNAELVRDAWAGSACGQSAATQRCKKDHLVTIHVLRDSCLAHITRVESSR